MAHHVNDVTLKPENYTTPRDVTQVVPDDLPDLIEDQDLAALRTRRVHRPADPERIEVFRQAEQPGRARRAQLWRIPGHSATGRRSRQVIGNDSVLTEPQLQLERADDWPVMGHQVLGSGEDFGDKLRPVGDQFLPAVPLNLT